MLEQEVEEKDDTVELHIPSGKRLGDVVLRFEKVCFSYDGEHEGPNEIEVKFRSDGHKSELKAQIRDGELRVEIEEEPHDGDDDD